MKYPDFVYFILYRIFGIMNYKKCGQLMMNPTDQKIIDHIEQHDIKGDFDFE